MPVLSMTNEDTKSLMETYRMLGGTMSDELIAKGDKLTDSITELKSAFSGLRNVIFGGLIEPLTKIVKQLTLGIGKMTIWLSAFMGIESTFGNLGTTISEDEDATNDLNKSATKLKRTLMGFDELNVLNDNETSLDDLNEQLEGVNGNSLIFDSDLLKQLTEYKESLEGLNKIQLIGDALFGGEHTDIEKWIAGIAAARWAVKSLTSNMKDKNTTLSDQTSKTKAESSILSSVLVPALGLAGLGVIGLANQLRNLNGASMPVINP